MLINGGRYLLHWVICACTPFPIIGLTVKNADTDTEIIERDVRNTAQLRPGDSPSRGSD